MQNGNPGVQPDLSTLSVSGNGDQNQQKQQQQQQQQPPGLGADEAAMTARLNVVWKRLMEIDADGAEARAAAILAGLSFDDSMMRR